MKTDKWENFLYRMIWKMRERQFHTYCLHKLKICVLYWFQERFWGFSDKDTWSLDYHLAQVIVPRLKRFKIKMQKFKGHPCSLDSFEQWMSIIDEMIEGFELIAKGAKYDLPFGKSVINNPKYIKMERALDLFREYYFALWW